MLVCSDDSLDNAVDADRHSPPGSRTGASWACPVYARDCALHSLTKPKPSVRSAAARCWASSARCTPCAPRYSSRWNHSGNAASHTGL